MLITYYEHNFNTIDDVFNSFQQQVNTNKTNTIVILNLIKEISKVIYDTTKDKPVNIRDSYINKVLDILSVSTLHSSIAKSLIINYTEEQDDIFSTITISSRNSTLTNSSRNTKQIDTMSEINTDTMSEYTDYEYEHLDSISQIGTDINENSGHDNLQESIFALQQQVRQLEDKLKEVEKTKQTQSYVSVSKPSTSDTGSDESYGCFPSTPISSYNTRLKSYIPKNLVHKEITPLQQKNIDNYYSQMNTLNTRRGYGNTGYYPGKFTLNLYG